MNLKRCYRICFGSIDINAKCPDDPRECFVHSTANNLCRINSVGKFLPIHWLKVYRYHYYTFFEKKRVHDDTLFVQFQEFMMDAKDKEDISEY